MIQPWAWLIVRPDVVDLLARIELRKTRGIKPIENRVWSTRYRGRFLVHASQRMTRADYESAADFAELVSRGAIEVPPFESIQRGGIVGVASLVDVLPLEVRPSEPWRMPNQFGWVVADVDPVPFRPCKGARGWWEYPPESASHSGTVTELERRIVEMCQDEIGKVSIERLGNVLSNGTADGPTYDELVLAVHDLLVVGMLEQVRKAPGSAGSTWYRLAKRAQKGTENNAQSIPPLARA